MSDDEFGVVAVEGHRIAALHATAPGMAEIGPLVGPLFDRVAHAMAAAGSPPGGDPSVATYTAGDDGSFGITAGFPYGGTDIDGVDVVDVPALEHAARGVHRGSMAGIGGTWQRLMQWAEQEGWAPAGPAREIYLSTPADDPDAWVTELQWPVTRA